MFIPVLQQGRRSTESFLKYYVVKSSPPLKNSVPVSITEEAESTTEAATDNGVHTQFNGEVNVVQSENSTVETTTVDIVDINAEVTSYKAEQVEEGARIETLTESFEDDADATTKLVPAENGKT